MIPALVIDLNQLTRLLGADRAEAILEHLLDRPCALDVGVLDGVARVTYQGVLQMQCQAPGVYTLHVGQGAISLSDHPHPADPVLTFHIDPDAVPEQCPDHGDYAQMSCPACRTYRARVGL